MYATNLTDQLFSAALPLKPLVAWCGSACSVTVAVPPAAALAGLNIGSVGVTLSLPDGSNVAAQAVHVANTPLWTATFSASNFATSGTVAQGLMVTLAGEDENGVVRTWIVAKGDLEVRPGDASPSPGGSWVAVKLRDSAPDDPVEGDAYVSDGELHIFASGEWVVIGGGAAPFDEAPQMAGAASPGESADYSRGDHVHPHDAAKLDGAAAYPAWEAGTEYPEDSVVSHRGLLWIADVELPNTEPGTPEGDADWHSNGVTIDSMKQDALSSAQLAAVNSGATAAKVATWDGYAAQIAAKANASDVATALAQKANATDLPYAMVTPGEWEFSGLPSGVTVVDFYYDPNIGWLLFLSSSTDVPLNTDGTADDLIVSFLSPSSAITATRASLPGHLCARAGNRVVVTGDTTLTLPAAVPGYIRDFLVRLEISGSTVPTITFAAPTGETITYETDGDEFPVPDEAGTWSYSFTENCVAHKFAVSLKKVNEVLQGGS